MDLNIPRLFGKLGESSDIKINTFGCTTSATSQIIKQSYSPKISIVSTESADRIAKQHSEDIDNIHQLFTYFENSLAYGESYNGSFVSNPIPSNSIANITTSGCVKFVGDTINFIDNKFNSSDELFNLDVYTKDLKDYVRKIDNHIRLLNDSPLDYNSYRKDVHSISNLENSIYLKMLTMLSSSDILSSFECFNHPIMQLAVISGNDSDVAVKDLISSFENKKYPAWYDKSSTLQQFIIIVNKNDNEMLQNALRIQEDLKIKRGKKSNIITIDIELLNNNGDNVDKIELISSLFVQNINEDNKDYENNSILKISKTTYDIWKGILSEIVFKDLILFMDEKMKKWNEEFIQPRTSLTGRLFGGRKWGSNSKPSFFSFGSNQSNNGQTGKANEIVSYNLSGGYYLANSPEMMIRKLGDWYFMLGDYKNAYTTYELVKKDMINDKANTHIASLQQYIIFSLILGATGVPEIPQITLKMISSMINPMINSSFYSFLSRSNLKSYALRFVILTAELYLLLGQKTKLMIQPTDTTLYFNESIDHFKKIIDSQLMDSLSTSFLMQRVAYTFYSFGDTHSNVQNISNPYYEEENLFKLNVLNPNLENLGSTRYRKVQLWLILSAEEINLKEQPIQAQIIIWRLKDELSRDPLNEANTKWLENPKGLFYQIENELETL